MKTSNHSQVTSLQQMWNTFDPSCIRDIISDRIHYESYWVQRPIRGKKRFLGFIKKELQTIKETMKKYFISVESQVVHTIGIEDEYSLIIKHLVKGIKKESLITVSVNNGKITKMGIEPVKRNS
jgi:hypothetical protein